MMLNSENQAYPLLEVMDIDKVKVDKTVLKKNLKIGIYKELNKKGLIDETEFIKLTTSVRTFEVGHAIMH